MPTLCGMPVLPYNWLQVAICGVIRAACTLSHIRGFLLVKHIKRCVLLFIAMFAAASLVSAQQPGTQGLRVVEHPVLGEYLADAEGKSLYVNLEDADGGGCPKSCQSYWPPLLSEQDLEAGSGVDVSLIATHRDEESQWHVSYGGWPLYYSRQDTKEGSTRGQGVAGVWFLISPDGDPLFPPEGAEAADTGAPEAPSQTHDLGADFLAVMEEGQQVFRHICATCHGSGGEGAIGIRLIGNKLLANELEIAGAIIRGQGYMPALGGQLTDAELAAALTYIRNSWGNQYGPVSEDTVQEARAE